MQSRSWLAVACALASCATSPEHVPTGVAEPGEPSLPPIESRSGDEISVAGQLFHTGTRVVLWDEPGAYDAYAQELRFPDEPGDPKSKPKGARHGIRKGLPDDVATQIADRGWSLAELRDQVDQFVVHYDVCGTSRQCFKILHDRRGLSVHFMLDVDGTIYQTLDLKERAWHGTKANDRSVGVEIAHIGAYPKPEHRVLVEWYDRNETDLPAGKGPRVRFPKWMKTTGVRTADFVARPARPALIEGVVQGQRLYQFDFTDEQYEALAHLVATLHEALPRIALDAPREPDGSVVSKVLDEDRFDAFEGVLGHFHVQKNKTDPGPAFDWERVLTRARELSARTRDRTD
ncbi:MAG: N-acetylmuramoyl-L-alanine amidase [Planctomycetes bacterium]|nr:N-acetylmuramoyl-L-alanine amidase [Planctomycetota bacterium]